jgi:hypothetical protein
VPESSLPRTCLVTMTEIVSSSPAMFVDCGMFFTLGSA